MDSPLTPSFSSYSSRRHSDTAARVVEEFRSQKSLSGDDDFGFYDDVYGIGPIDPPSLDDEDEDDEEFEFPVGLDGVCNAPKYPLFNTELVFGAAAVPPPPPPPPPQRLSLGKLFSEERKQGSPEIVDDLDGAQPESYCVWSPEMAAQAKRKKSNSTGHGGSGRWCLRDFRRSFSDGRMNSSRSKAAKADNRAAVSPEMVIIPAPKSESKKDVERNLLKKLLPDGSRFPSFSAPKIV